MADRTQDFLQCVHAFANQQDSSVLLKKSGKSSGIPKTKSAFNEAAADIARGVHRTSNLLGRLTNLVRKQGLFDDPTEEINNLIYRIKEELNELNTKCDSAQQFIDQQKSFFTMGSDSTQNHASQHNNKVVSHLKSDLMNTTKDFKSILEMRSMKMKDQQQRKVELIGKGMLSPLKAIEQHHQQLHKTPNNQHSSGNGRFSTSRPAFPSPYVEENGLKMITNTTQAYDDPYSNNNSNNNSNSIQQQHQQQQQLLLEPVQTSNQYYEQREKSVTEVEKTIGELGTLFKRLASMIAEQQELVERIDEDVESAIDHTEQAKNAIMKAYEQVSSNWGMYMKIAAILGVFILFFVLFLM